MLPQQMKKVAKAKDFDALAIQESDIDENFDDQPLVSRYQQLKQSQVTTY